MEANTKAVVPAMTLGRHTMMVLEVCANYVVSHRNPCFRLLLVLRVNDFNYAFNFSSMG